MTAKQLTDSILQMAIQGKLVPQDPNDEPASVLLEHIREKKRKLVTEGKLKKKELEETPIDDEEITYDVPQGWTWVRMESLCSVKGGKRIPVGETFASSPTNHIYIRVTDMKNHSLSNKSLKYISDALYERLKQYTISKDDLYLTIAGTIGDVGIVPEDFDGMNLTENAVKLCYIHVYKMYLLYAILSPFVQAQFIDKTKQMAQPKLAIERIKSTLMPLPPLAEQHRIVERIEEYLPVIKEYGEAYDEAFKMDAELPDKLKKSILQEAIMGKLGTQDPSDAPASCLLNDIRAEKQKLVKEGVLKKKDLVETPVEDDEVPFNIPKDWEWIRFGDLVATSTGKTPARGEVVYWSSNDYPWVSISDMKQGEVVNSTREFISKKAANDCFHNAISKKGTLIMSFKLTVGRTSILGMDAYHNEAIISIKTYADNDNYTRDYLAYILPIIANSGDSKDAIKGKTLNSKSIYNLLVPLPPLAEQHRIVQKIEELYAEIDNMTIENNININEIEETEKD